MEETYIKIRRDVRELLEDYLPDYEFTHIHYNEFSGKILVCLDVKYQGKKHSINAKRLSVKEVAEQLKIEWRMKKNAIDDLNRAIGNINKLNSYFNV